MISRQQIKKLRQEINRINPVVMAIGRIMDELSADPGRTWPRAEWTDAESLELLTILEGGREPKNVPH